MGDKNVDCWHYAGKVNGMDGDCFHSFRRSGVAVIYPLEFLHGAPWDDLALAWVSALRPSRVRVISDAEQCDSQVWRVTVYVSDGTITSIMQEVSVGLPISVEHGHDLMERTSWFDAYRALG